MVLGGLVRHHGAVGWEVLESDELEGMHDLFHLVEGKAPVEEDEDEVAVSGLGFIHQTGKAVTGGRERGRGRMVRLVDSTAHTVLESAV